MELENTINSTEFAAESESGKENKFPNLVIAAVILFAMNVVVLLFFYLSPNLLAVKSKQATDDQYAVAKASPFEERVRDTKYVPRRVEKVRPVIEVSFPVTDPALTSSIYTDASATTYAGNSDSSYQPASFTMNAGDRPAAASLIQASQDDARRGTQVAASIPARTSDF
jgi:hypothetical protein